MALSCVVMINVASGVANAGPISWVDWTSHTGGIAGSATGTLPGGVTVTYAGQVASETRTAPGGLTNYWTQAGPSPYTNGTVDNPPPCCDIITLIGGSGLLSTLTFSTPLVNPIMGIVSLGQPGFLVSYDFVDRPFDVLSSGTGFWGGAPGGSLFELAGDVLQGNEGHGTIQFIGTLSSISWTTAPAENWHGFQIGIVQQSAVPDGGSAFALLGLGMLGLSTIRRKLL